MSSRRFALFLFAGLAFSSAALADTPMELVPVQSSMQGKSVTVQTKGAPITTADFAAQIMDVRE